MNMNTGDCDCVAVMPAFGRIATLPELEVEHAQAMPTHCQVISDELEMGVRTADEHEYGSPLSEQIFTHSAQIVP
jgi:hypothetical protein